MKLATKINAFHTKVLLLNLVTISRIVFAVLAFFPFSNMFYLTITIWAGLSDFLDGLIARKFNLETRFGAQIDQLADKIFHGFFILFFTLEGSVPLYFTVLFFVRESVIIILRYLNISNKNSNFLGKLKTTLLYLLIIFVFLSRTELNVIEFINKEMVLTLLEALILATAYISLFLSLRKQDSK
jgi:CDP-diacylglycerol--glycerol-3-phosphate 3-phosphatidyltransferase